MVGEEDFSQNGEQAYILKAFEGQQAGRFLDLGAFHPWLLSNTRALYLRGWGGVVVDVSPLCVNSMVEEYGNSDRVAVVQAAVGMARGLTDFHVSNGAITTSSEKMHERWAGTLLFNGKLVAATITLEDIADKFGSFDFLSIDTEGSSFELFTSAMEIGWRPRCVCCDPK